MTFPSLETLGRKLSLDYSSLKEIIVLELNVIESMPFSLDSGCPGSSINRAVLLVAAYGPVRVHSCACPRVIWFSTTSFTSLFSRLFNLGEIDNSLFLGELTLKSIF